MKAIISALLGTLLFSLSASVVAQLPQRDCEFEADLLSTESLRNVRSRYLDAMASLADNHDRRVQICDGNAPCITSEKNYTKSLQSIYYDEWQDAIRVIKSARASYVASCQASNALIAAEWCSWNPNSWECPGYNDPLVLDMGGNGFRFTDLAIDPVMFDIDNDGDLELMAWTEAGSDDAFLVFDRNDNNEVDDGSELFGNHTMMLSGDPAVNGFVALMELDLPDWGGNADGILSKDDEQYKKLALWIDEDHDGQSDKGEVKKLKKEIEVIDLEYTYVLELGPNGNPIPFHSVAILKGGQSDKSKKSAKGGKSKKSGKSGKNRKDSYLIDIVDVFLESSDLN